MRVERLTGQDLVALTVDDLGWPEDIGAIAIINGGRRPGTRVRVAAFEKAWPAGGPPRTAGPSPTPRSCPLAAGCREAQAGEDQRVWPPEVPLPGA
jgi:hypothetical protein